MLVRSPGRGGRRARRVLAAFLGVALAATTVATPAYADKQQAADKPQAAAAPAPPPIPWIQIELHNRLQNLLGPALRVAGSNTQVRAVVRYMVGWQFDGDTNALWSDIISEAEASDIVDPWDPDWVALKNAVAQFQNVDGYNYDPQVYIPNYDEGIVPASTVTMAVAPADETATSTTGYQLDWGGGAMPVATIDEAYVATNEVWVLSVNERIELGPNTVTVTNSGDSAKQAEADKNTKAGPPAPAAKAPAGSGAHTLANCNPTGIRNPRGEEYLKQWRVWNDTFGSLFEGKREMRLVVISATGFVIKNYFFGKIKKKDIDDWQHSDLFLTTWDEAVWGKAMGYQWYELDGGRTTSSTISVPSQNGSPAISTTISRQENDDDAGGTAVLRTESANREYDTGHVLFNLCTQGGDGGTGGTDNLACGALASASSTYSGYGAFRATDCDRDTRLGGPYSWANDWYTYPPANPEWIQADFGVDKTIGRVVVYTSEGYPIRDFDVQVWNGATYVTVGSVNGNTQLTITVTFSPRTTRLVRILGRSGPDHQPGFVRVNELEAYAM